METLTALPEAQFRLALTDATMLAPNQGAGGILLLPADTFDVRLGGDASVADSNSMITVPLQKIVITIGTSYGEETGYPGDSAKDLLITLPFSIWGNTQAEIDDTMQYLNFARDQRQAVFSAFGLTEYGNGVRVRARHRSPIDGLVVTDVHWRFCYSRP